MNIHLARHLGLCFGVRDAIDLAERLAAEAPLTVLGELAHNPRVRERLLQAGAREGSLNPVGAASTARVLVTAHGASAELLQAWERAGFEVADATCPLVRHAHAQLNELVGLGCQPVIIGRRGHAEVAAMIGNHPKTMVVETMEELGLLPPHHRYGVIAQTTQPIARVNAIVAELRRLRPQSEVWFRDTVCRPTKDRQLALASLLMECDTVVVVGGRGSNNTRELVAAVVGAGRAVHHVECAEELQEDWFSTAQEVGLTAGTSTLPETISAVHERLLAISLLRHRGGCHPGAVT